MGAVSASAVAQFPSSPEQMQTRPQSDLPPVGRGAPERSYSDETGAPFIGELAKRSGDRPATMSDSERRATRERYDDLGPTEAADLARRMFPDELGTPVFDLADPPGASLVRTSGRFAAVLKDDESGETGLMLSSSPVRQTIKHGADPVDLTLERVGDTFKPEVPLIDTRFTADPQEALSFPGREVSVGLATTSERDPLVRDDRANHFEARTDTDLILTPRPEGAELFLQLRGPDAPTEFLVDVDMPAGATLREFKPENPIPGDTEGPWPVEVVEDGRQLAVVYPPSAHDAEGRPVASRLRIDDNNLRLSVEHRGRLLAYPVLADPEVYVPQYEGQPSSWSGWRHQNFRSQTSIQQNHYPFFGASLGNTAYGPGLYLSMPTNQGYYNGDFSELIWQAPVDVFVTRARLNWMSHSPFYSGTFHGITNAPNSAWEGGLGYVNQNNERGGNPFGVATHAFYGVTHDFCYGSPSCNLGGTDQNNVVVGLQALPPGCCMGTGANKAVAQVNSAELYLGDRFNPTFVGGLATSRDWFDDTGQRTRSTIPRVTDRGLGVQQITMTGAATGGGTQTYGCSGHPYASPCPKDTASNVRAFNYTLNEGVNDLTVRAIDAAGRPTATHAWTERVDRTQPVLGEISGSLYEARTRTDDRRFSGLYGDEYQLKVSATDAHSGIAGIDVVAIDSSGRRVELASTTTGTFGAIRVDQLVDGDYTIEIRARDRVGVPTDRHVAIASFPVTLDRVGSVLTAAQYDGGPSAAGERLGFEQFELGGVGARHDEDGLLEATRVVACRTSADRSCVERRTRTELDDGGEHLSIRRTPATAEATGGDASSAIVTRRDVRAQAQDGGPIETALAKWQMPPPGHGTRHLVFEESERGYVDEEQVTITRRVLLDAATGLPLRDTRRLGDMTERDIWWSYGRSRATIEEIPADAFAPARSDGAAADEDTEDLSAAPAPAPAPATSAEDRLASAVTFRRAFSLNTDRTFVQALLDDATLVKSRNLYGTPLAGSELTELLERERLVDERAIVNRFGRERSDSFAGAWIDHANGGVLRVGFTSEAVDRVAALKQVHPLPDRLVAFTAERTLAQLDALQKRVETDFDGLAGLGVHAVADDVTRNAVEVSVTSKTAEVESELKSRYGSGVRVVEAPMADAERSELRNGRVVPPLLAGLGIGPSGCSSAFTVRASNRRFRYLTAGHCTDRVGENVSHTNDLPGERPRQVRAIGQVSARKYGGSVDATQVAVRADQISPFLYLAPGSKRNAFRRIGKTAGADQGDDINSGPLTGTILCFVGVNEDEQRCSELESKSATVKYKKDNVKLTDQRKTSNNSADGDVRGGDSGGAWFRKDTAWGVHSGGTKENSYHTRMDRVTKQWNTVLFVGLP